MSIYGPTQVIRRTRTPKEGTPVPSTLRPPADPPVVLHAHAAAKINLALLVGERRADSFHEIVTVLQAIGLWDDLEVRLVPEGLGLEVEGEGLPPAESNLVLVAARELARRTRDLPGARFRLRKGIPVAAGLGGGSADAAAALLALDRLWGLRLPVMNLDALAGGDLARLGASLANDLEPAAFDLLPGLRAGKERLLEAGVLGAVMSGSGPTLLGLCRDEEHAGRVARAVRSGFARGPVPGVTFG